ncbi:ribosomal protein S6 [Herpetosiphon aurantiacus DSM 785]|uniref:Small ribosomal subunit protein bS6 n=1 Tax=Herpetosiphon aurantiacus (strain ATCC 23779 / DSM 785 / 114-95) TaxID=316274 RepID=A9B459_HERA2|nr:ribosomal protein S6 [Herpetosiphon aurantiacus DSM 785]
MFHVGENIVRAYEMMTVLRPDLGGEEELNTTIETIQGYIKAQGGEVASTEQGAPWGRRKLAYPIDDYTEGFYFLTHFTLNADRVTEVERHLKLAPQILRYLLIRDETKR